MTTKVQKFQLYVSPFGSAIWPKLTEPDFKFNKDFGTLSIGIRMTEEAAQPLIEELTAYADHWYAETDSEAERAPLWKPDLDRETKEPTGDLIFSFKRAAAKLRDGAVVKNKIAVVDPMGKPFEGIIGAGSTVRASGFMSWYDNANGFGVSLQLQAVQVTQHVESNDPVAAFGEVPASAMDGLDVGDFG